MKTRSGTSLPRAGSTSTPSEGPTRTSGAWSASSALAARCTSTTSSASRTGCGTGAYFDGDSTYGSRDDYSWYGGENRKGYTYSCWYNHRRAVVGRLFAWDIPTDDFTVTDEEVEAQGFVYKWIPAGVRVTPHLDVLWPEDIQEAIPDNTGTTGHAP